MPPLQPVGATALMLTAKLVTLGRIVAGRGSVSHSGHLSRGEQLQLSHRTIISHAARRVPSDPLMIMPISGKIRWRSPFAYQSLVHMTRTHLSGMHEPGPVPLPGPRRPALGSAVRGCRLYRPDSSHPPAALPHSATVPGTDRTPEASSNCHSVRQAPEAPTTGSATAFGGDSRFTHEHRRSAQSGRLSAGGSSAGPAKAGAHPGPRADRSGRVSAGPSERAPIRVHEQIGSPRPVPVRQSERRPKSTNRPVRPGQCRSVRASATLVREQTRRHTGQCRSAPEQAPTQVHEHTRSAHTATARRERPPAHSRRACPARPPAPQPTRPAQRGLPSSAWPAQRGLPSAACLARPPTP